MQGNHFSETYMVVCISFILNNVFFFFNDFSLSPVTYILFSLTPARSLNSSRILVNYIKALTNHRVCVLFTVCLSTCNTSIYRL